MASQMPHIETGSESETSTRRLSDSSSAIDEPWLLYDGECPFCSRYVGLIRLRESIGPVRIINIRQGGQEVEQAMSAGLDLDEGMLLHYEGQMYHGADCLNRLALLTTSNTSFNRLNAWLFKNATFSKLSYPILRVGRNLTLKLLGRPRLENLGDR
jgi:predicted DCC family thiol-disulfide oxidoreductase YuxK